jgi:phosphoenolpyruvate carboxylase
MSQLPAPVTQNADVRFLGKLLGDVIRRHGGDALFQRIEAIRAASVDRYRGVANPRGFAAGWETLSLDETVAFVRSFMLFSMLISDLKIGSRPASRSNSQRIEDVRAIPWFFS